MEKLKYKDGYPFMEDVFKRISSQSRHDRRASYFEYQNIFETIFKVEDDFCNAVFLLEKSELMLSTDRGELFINSYKDLYNIYLEEFKEKVEYVKSVHKAKHFQVNPDYFEQTYKPIEAW